MSCCCCMTGNPATKVPAVRRGRISALLQWALPIVTLALIPKCPACVAAYVLLFTGVGMSFHVAAAVRWGFVGLSIGSLAYLGVCAARPRQPRA